MLLEIAVIIFRWLDKNYNSLRDRANVSLGEILFPLVHMNEWKKMCHIQWSVV